MEKIDCKHCGYENDHSLVKCIKCQAPLHQKIDDRAERNARKFKFYFVGLVIFCFAIMYYAPRVIP